MTAQLPQVLVRNSFNILGLSSSAALKEIRKRSQQLLQLAKIEESQEFDTDIGHVRELRTESEIRLALERVSGIQERLREIFFWFDDHSIESKKAVSLISKQDYQKALDIFEKFHQENADWLGCKNLALALMFHAFSDSSFDSFFKSLNLWKLIADSDDFWKFYEKHYLLHDELGTSPSLFEEFRGSICEYLSAKAVYFYHQTRNAESIGIYYTAFRKIGEAIDTQIIQPVVLKIKKEIECLEKTASLLSEGDEISDDDESTIKLALKKIEKHFLELDKFDLSEYSSLTILKNHIAEALRSICIGVYNQDLLSTDMALSFLDLSEKLVISDIIADKIESDKKQIKENQFLLIKNCELLVQYGDIKELIWAQRFEEAQSSYLKLDNELANKDDESSNGSRVCFLLEYCSKLMEIGHALFEKKKFGIKILVIDGLLNWRNQKDAVHVFEKAFALLTDRIHLLSFIDPSSDRAILKKTIDNISSSLKNCEISSLVDYHQFYLNTIDEIANGQQNEKTQAAIRLLGAALCFSIFYRRFRGVLQRKTWKWIGWGTAITFYFLIIMGNDTDSKISKQSIYRTTPSHSSDYSLTYEEKQVIEYLQKNDPEVLRKIRKEGYSDKQIARYVIEQADDEEE